MLTVQVKYSRVHVSKITSKFSLVLSLNSFHEQDWENRVLSLFMSTVGFCTILLFHNHNVQPLRARGVHVNHNLKLCQHRVEHCLFLMIWCGSWHEKCSLYTWIVLKIEIMFYWNKVIFVRDFFISYSSKHYAQCYIYCGRTIFRKRGWTSICFYHWWIH